MTSNIAISGRSSCVRADGVMDSHTTGPGFKTCRVRYTFYKVSDWSSPQQYHRVECSLHVWKIREGLLDRVWPKTLKWVVVYSSVTFHINGYHSNRSALCLYTVTGWGVRSCVCDMAFNSLSPSALFICYIKPVSHTERRIETSQKSLSDTACRTDPSAIFPCRMPSDALIRHPLLV